MFWIALVSYVLQVVTAWAADAPVPSATAGQASREIAVPVQVVASDDDARAEQAEISIFVLSQEAGHGRRGKLIVRSATGAKGEQCVVRLAPSLAPVLIEARQVGGSRSVLGSTVIAFDRERSVWKPQAGLIGRSPRESRATELLQERATQPTLFVKIPDRGPARIYVVASHYERLPNFAEVMIFAMNGKCIRRGFPRGTGEGFDAERYRPLDPGYRRLLVVARGWQNGRLLSGSVLLVFDRNNWRPVTRYEQFVGDPGKRSGDWQAATDYDSATGQFEPILDGALWSPSQIRVPVPAHPLPLWKPGESVDAPPSPPSSCCRDAQVPVEEELLKGIRKEFGLGKEPLAAPAIENLASREAAIVEAGRPLAPGHKWADFGHRWVRGPSNMYWQAALDKDKL